MNKILIADDEEAICRLYSEELKGCGYEVTWTTDGAKLLNMIQQDKPGVILLDVRMGPYDGLELLHDIRNAYYDIPVILWSAYSFFRFDPKSIAADYYVVKSVDLTELKQKIEMAFEGCATLLTALKKNQKTARWGTGI